MKKRFGIFLITLCMCLGLLSPDVTVWAAAGKTYVSVSASSVNIGDTVTVTGKATGPSEEKVLATMTLSWDENVLQYVSCSVDSNGGGGSRLVNGDNFTVTLKAISAGTSAISLSATDGVLFDTVESLDSMEGSSTSVTVNNAASENTGGNTDNSGNTDNGGNAGNGGSAGTDGGNTNAGGNVSSGGSTTTEKLSGDNSLKSLTISPGTLSPSFSYNRTSYTATVGSDVTSIAVSATPANDKAVVESVTGNSNLTEGTNTIRIVVKAENGVTATYTIKVTKQAASGGNTNNPQGEEKPEPTDEEPTQESVMVNGNAYQISEDFKDADIPVDFTESEINYHGNQYKGVTYTKGALNLLWMVPQNMAEDDKKTGKFFIYDETRDNVYPFVRFTNGENYVIALASPVDFTMPETYLQTSLAVDEENTIIAYQKMAESESEIVSEFYVFYGVNHEGTENWYQYDAMEETYQRLSTAIAEEEDGAVTEDMAYLQEEYTALSEKYAAEKAYARNMMAVLVFIIAVLVIVIINLFVYKFRKQQTDEFFENGLEDDELPEEELPEEEMPDEESEPEEEAPDEDSMEEELPEEEADERDDASSASDDLEIIDFNDL